MKGAEMTAADIEDNRLLVGDGATDNTTSATTAPSTGIVGRVIGLFTTHCCAFESRRRVLGAALMSCKCSGPPVSS